VIVNAISVRTRSARLPLRSAAAIRGSGQSLNPMPMASAVAPKTGCPSRCAATPMVAAAVGRRSNRL
jgi:hypothetical protein